MMSNHSYTPEQLEAIRSLIEEANNKLPAAQQLKAQQVSELITFILGLPVQAITAVAAVVTGATGILTGFIGSLLGILEQLIGLITGGGAANGAAASILQQVAPNLVNIIEKQIPAPPQGQSDSNPEQK
ncbi:hypothetical protein C1X05_10370 [Laceyella sacchari]|nr:hypothetical protein C1X05_10370 [Laceyella sacchari]